MLINLVKFIHILSILGILGSAFFCAALLASKKFLATNSNQHIYFLNRAILYLSTLGIITGTLLVYPKHFTFHTPWIQAAYLFMVIFSLGILFLQKKMQLPRLIKLFTYLILIVILIGVIHDAVTKSTFIL